MNKKSSISLWKRSLIRKWKDLPPIHQVDWKIEPLTTTCLAPLLAENWFLSNQASNTHVVPIESDATAFLHIVISCCCCPGLNPRWLHHRSKRGVLNPWDRKSATTCCYFRYHLLPGFSFTCFGGTWSDSFALPERCIASHKPGELHHFPVPVGKKGGRLRGWWQNWTLSKWSYVRTKRRSTWISVETKAR